METSFRPNSKFEILTKDGWSDFDGIRSVFKENILELTLASGKLLGCSSDHKIMISENNFEFVSNLKINDKVCGEPIISIKKLQPQIVYDPVNVSKNNAYISNEFISHNCEFLGSSGTLIAGWKLKELVPRAPIVEKEGLIQYFAPEKDHMYLMICDVSRGKGLDYSAFQLIDVTRMPYQQAALYRNNAVTPVDYAEVIHRVAKAYNNASVLVEVNDIGEQVSHTLHYDFSYDNVLFTENAGRSGKRITSGFGGKGIDKGIRTTKIVKSIGCSILKLLVEQNQLIINDFHTIAELATFSKKGTSYEAEPGCHDDLVMCLVLFSWLSEQQYFKDYTNINTLMSLREKTEEDLEQDMSPFGFIFDGRDEYDETIEKFVPDSWMWNVNKDF
jgi:Terminase RNaseH-like domain